MTRAETPGPERETTMDERLRWGDCPVCEAPHGEYCHADVGIQLGRPVGGGRSKDGDGVHLARIQRAPMRVKEVPV